MVNPPVEFHPPDRAHSLRPYPELPDQGFALSRLATVYLGVQRVKEIISKQFQSLYEIFSYYPENYLINRSFSIPSPIIVKSETETFDQKCNYIIRDGQIYFKPIAALPSDPWKELPFPKKVTRISADGDNLIVVDESKQIYYAKTNVIDFRITDCGWKVAPFELAWKSKWFNMDGVSRIVNYFKPATLYAMEGSRALAISHKGKDTLYHTDMGGKKHPDPLVGVTTLYMLNPKGDRIFFADPWLPNKFHNEITGPENGRFIAENMDASASTLFLIQRAKNAEGREINKMYTRYADFDSIGSNPLLPATYDRSNKTPLVRILPGEDWVEQPSITLEGQARLTKKISISQTGRGQANRQLRVEGTDSYGQTGYYVKTIYAPTWRFERTNHVIPEADFLPRTLRGPGLLQGPAIAHDYEGWIDSDQQRLTASLRQFSTRGINERGLHAAIEITLPSGETISCPLYARRGMIHLLGLESREPYWTLVAPENAPPPFKTQEVTVIKEDHRFVVIGKGFKAFFPKDRQIIVQRKRPSYPIRLLIKTALIILEAIKFILKMCRRVIDNVLNDRKTTKAQERIHNSMRLQDSDDTKKVMQRLVAKNPSLAPQVLIDFLSRPSVSPHFRKLMHGANTAVLGRTDELYQKLKELPGAKQRRSSHAHQPGTSYGVETPLFGELLFWKDEQGNLRLQFEAHSLRNVFKFYYHMVDYLRYKLHAEQQGLYGSSKYTDAHPIEIRI